MTLAFKKIAVWRKEIVERAIDAGTIPPKGHQNQGWDKDQRSRVAECQPYQGRPIPVNTTYLTVECAISQLPFESESEKESFKRFVFQRMRTERSLESKAVKARQKGLGLLLIASLGMEESVFRN